MHQAEIKGSSKIRTRTGTRLVDYSDDKEGLVINRLEFHRQLVEEFKDYVKRLRTNAPEYKDLREKFKNKMDVICKAK